MRESVQNKEKLLTDIFDLNLEVRTLRSEARTHKKMQEESDQTSEYLRSIIETSLDCICVSDAKGTITRVNKSFLELLGYPRDEMIGKMFAEFSILQHGTYESTTGEIVHIDDAFFEDVEAKIARLLTRGKLTNWETYYVRKDGKIVPVEQNIVNLYDTRRELIGTVGIVRDITDRKKSQRLLLEAHRKLQEKVQERTASLEEANTALRVLLKGVDEEKKSVEAKIITNVNELVMPYLEKIRASNLDERQGTYLDIAETNLKDIISPFLPRLSSRYLKLTPVEIQVANFIKQGKTCKQIGSTMNLSSKTIETHRKNIRNKLGIRNKKTNLRTYLITLAR